MADHSPPRQATAADAQLLGAAVLLQGRALRDVQGLVGLAMREVQRRDGITPPARLVEVVRLLGRAVEVDRLRRAASDGGQILGVDGAAAAGLSWVRARPLTTRQAAQVLHLSDRQVRRLMVPLRGHRVGGVILYDGDAVASLAACRARSARRAAGPTTTPEDGR